MFTELDRPYIGRIKPDCSMYGGYCGGDIVLVHKVSEQDSVDTRVLFKSSDYESGTAEYAVHLSEVEVLDNKRDRSLALARFKKAGLLYPNLYDKLKGA